MHASVKEKRAKLHLRRQLYLHAPPLPWQALTNDCVLLISAGFWWELCCSAQRKREDPPAGPLRERVGLAVLSDGRCLRPAAAVASPSPGPEPQQPAGVSFCNLPSNGLNRVTRDLMITGKARDSFVLVCFWCGAEFEEPDPTGPAGEPASVSAGGAAVSALAEHAECLPELRRSRTNLWPRCHLPVTEAAQPLIQQNHHIPSWAGPHHGTAGGAVYGGVGCLERWQSGTNKNYYNSSSWYV